MAEPVGTCQCSPLRFDERAEERAALTEANCCRSFERSSTNPLPSSRWPQSRPVTTPSSIVKSGRICRSLRLWIVFSS